MIYVGLDDTDVVDSPGTNQLARLIAREVREQFHVHLIVRHQLLNDPRVPYTSQNGCASMLLEPRHADATRGLPGRLAQMVLDWSPPGSDPGLCVTETVPPAITGWGHRCQEELVSQIEARQLAEQFGIYLAGLGGTEGGVIGALAAVGLLAERQSGRVIHLGSSNHDLFDVSGLQTVEQLLARGIDEVHCGESKRPIQSGEIDVGKRLRPNLHVGKVVLFVRPAPLAFRARWQALRPK